MDEQAKPSIAEGKVLEHKKDVVTPSISLSERKGLNHRGVISEQIGTGEHAKDSFIWMTLRNCFYIGFIFSVCIFIAYYHFVFDKNDASEIDIVAALKDVWSIFTPILTLALGYAFGKRDHTN
ncbi:hypothetical protein [Pantoea ananatis]|uniref:hypothetical protein n=1 Tax=Pantoea ananas TaxID=553 RepID=UPI00301B09F2